MSGYTLPVEWPPYARCVFPQARSACRDASRSLHTRETGYSRRLSAAYRPGVRSLFVYILANHSRRLYIGVTNNLRRRVAEHRLPNYRGYAASFGITRLVYYEVVAGPRSAIAREKQLKKMLRKAKLALIERDNPNWRELWLEIQ